MNYYVHEKLNELEAELRARKGSLPGGSGAGLTSLPRGSGFNLTGGAGGRLAVFGPVFRVTGRTLRRLGEGLESWAAQPMEPEQRPFLDRRAG